MPNNTIPEEIPASEVYQMTYETIFAKLSQDMKERVLAVKSDNYINDPDVDAFVRQVIEVAESVMDNCDKKAPVHIK